MEEGKRDKSSQSIKLARPTTKAAKEREKNEKSTIFAAPTSS